MNQPALDLIEEESITSLNSEVAMGFSSGALAAVAADIALENELARNPFVSKLIDLVNSKAEYEGELNLSQGNGNDVTKIGTFNNTISGGVMGTTIDLPVTVSKDNTFKLVVGFRVTSSVTEAFTQDNLTVDTGDNLVTDTGDNLVVNTE